jgi:hypothetical protein
MVAVMVRRMAKRMVVFVVVGLIFYLEYYYSRLIIRSSAQQIPTKNPKTT